MDSGLPFRTFLAFPESRVALAPAQEVPGEAGTRAETQSDGAALSAANFCG